MGFLCPRRKARKPQNDNFNVFTHSAKQGRGVHAAHSPRVGALPPEHPTLHLQENERLHGAVKSLKGERSALHTQLQERE